MTDGQHDLPVEVSQPPTVAFTTHPQDRRPAVIADANALISDSMRRTKGLFNVMPFLAQRGGITLMTAEHIDEKVYARLPEACEHNHVDVRAATAAYETVHRPLLRLVEVGDLMRYDERVNAVALADLEDVPVAQLGVLLAPSLVLTHDQKLLDAGIGVHDWADALLLRKELIELDEMLWGTASGVVLAGVMTVAGTTQFVRFLGRSRLALGFFLGLALGLGYHFSPQLREAPTRVKEKGGPVLDTMFKGMSDTTERRQAAERRVQGTLVRPHPMETLEAMVARVLVQAHEPLSAERIWMRLPFAWRHAEVAGVMDALRESPPFELVRGRGWRLGHPAVARRRALPPG